MTTDRPDPVLSGARSFRLLSGLSGVSVYLLTLDGENWFVRKAATITDHSVRLKAQSAKQIRFTEETPGPVRTPRVIGEGEIDGRYYFDMEYVRGVDGATFLRRASYDQVTQFADRLCDYLNAAATTAPFGPSRPTSLFEALFAKVCSVYADTDVLDDQTLGRVMLMLDQVRRAGSLTPTLCHGDLTLENLIIDPDEDLWLIDLLDSPVEHYWQDVAKLHQDLTGGWYLRREARISRGVLDFVSGRILQQADKLDPTYRHVHRALLTASFIRILPYARTSDDTAFVLDRIAYLTSDPSASADDPTSLPIRPGGQP